MLGTDADWIEAFAPAKINLALHVTGLREDGYHLLDSLVAFADVGDVVRLRPALKMSLRVTGPMAAGVPADQSNLVWKAAEWFGTPPVEIELEKHLPAAAGIGGGSSDAAATLRVLSQRFGKPLPKPAQAVPLGADLPVCLSPVCQRMTGIGERLLPAEPLPPLEALLVNPGVSVSTPRVFAALDAKNNAAMQDMIGPWGSAREACLWLAAQRNDLEPAAMALVPEVGQALRLLQESGAPLVRMSGSGATCFAASPRASDIDLADAIVAKARPDWWVARCRLN